MADDEVQSGGLKTGGPLYYKMNIAMMAFTVVLSYDFMATFLTIYFYYQAVTDGAFQRYYGLFFASYQIGLFIGSPIMAKWAEIGCKCRIGKQLPCACFTLLDYPPCSLSPLSLTHTHTHTHTHSLSLSLSHTNTLSRSPFLRACSLLTRPKRNIREPSICCLVLNVLGNLLYVIANVTTEGSAGGLLLLFSGRFLAGVGAAGLTVSMLYLAKICDPHRRIGAMNTYRFWQFLGKVSAPLVGTFFLYFPSYQLNSFSLNGATYPALSTAVLGVVTIVPVILFCIKLPKPDGPRISLVRDKAARPMLRDALIVSAMYTGGSMCIWIVFSQVMTIGVVLFQIADTIDEASNLWYIYIPPIVGAVVSMILVKRIVKSGAVKDYMVMGLGALGLTISLFFFFQFKSKESPIIYFIGGTLLFLSNGTFLTAYRGVYATIVGDSPHVEMMMSVMIMGLCVGGILGSLISGSVLSVQQIAECSSACVPEAYQYDCCEMSGLNPVVLVGLLCMGAVLLAYAALFIPRSRLPSLAKANVDHVHDYNQIAVQEGDGDIHAYGTLPASQQFA